MRGIVIVLLMGLCEMALSQTPKPSPASDTLVQTAKDMAAEKASFETIRNQARSTVDASAKQLQDQLKAKTDALMTELKADKKYSGKLAEIDTITKQMSSLNAGANDKFQKDTAPIQQKIATDNAVIGGLIPIVRKESGFPDTTTFDVDTQKWKDAPASNVVPKKE